jgi:hypothetical protein
MAIHWQIKFRPLRANTLYTVNIYDNSYTGNPVQLTGADNPFVTQEDSDDDMFLPVRTQSGYLRFVDDGTVNWRGIIPSTDTDRPVVLTNSSGQVQWQGFMQAQNFGLELYGTPQTIEFPLQCPLSVTSATQIYNLHTNMENFAYLLLEIISSIPSTCRPTEIYIQGGTSAQTALLKMIDWQNFVEIKHDGTVTSRFNLFECLEEMCRFWGWTARIHRKALYLTCAYDMTQNLFLKMTSDDLMLMANGTTAGTTVGFIPAGFGQDIFASLNNEDMQMRGPSKAVVTANCNAGDTDVVKAFPDTVIKSMYSGSSYTETYDNGKRAIITSDVRSISSAVLIGTCNSDVSFNVMRVTERGLTVAGSDYKVIRIKPSYRRGIVLASLETIYSHNYYDVPISGFSSGGLFMSFDVLRQGEHYEYANEMGVGMSTIWFRVGIGEKRSTALWYNGSSTWSSSPVEFLVRIGGVNQRDQKWSCRTNNPNLHGRLFVDIMGSDDMEHVSEGGFIDRFDLVNFKIEFKRSVHDGISSVFDLYERENTHDYMAYNQGMVEKKWECNTVFVSDNQFVFGYGILMNPDGTPYTGGDIRPEQQLAFRVVNYWSTSKRKLSCEFRDDIVIDLGPQIIGTLDGTRVHPISVSHDWRNDIMQAILMEV